MTEWNTLTFADMKTANPDKISSQVLDMLFQRGRDLQSLLQEPYNSPLLLRDCIIRAVKRESFYLPLITTQVPTDPNTLHTRLHQCIRQMEVEKPAQVTKGNVFYVDPDDKHEDENNEEITLHFNDNGQPFFKRRIMRGSSSFSTLNYSRGNRRFQRGPY